MLISSVMAMNDHTKQTTDKFESSCSTLAKKLVKDRSSGLSKHTPPFEFSYHMILYAFIQQIWKESAVATQLISFAM